MNQLQAEQKKLLDGKWMQWAAGFFVGGLVLHWLFTDGTRFDFTFGMFVIVVTGVVYVAKIFDVKRVKRELADNQRRREELEYRWIANGGLNEKFWDYRYKVVRKELELENAGSDGHDAAQEAWQSANDAWWWSVQRSMFNKATNPVD
jgi:hypothetical protein